MKKYFEKNKTMKIELTQPFYNLNKELLDKDTESIKNSEFMDGIRRRLPFFMDECRYGIISAQKRWGVNIVFFEAGHNQVKKVWIDEGVFKKVSKVWLDNFKKDKNFLKELKKELLNIISLQKKISKGIPDKDMAPGELEKHLVKRLNIMNIFFEFYMIWYAAENIISNKEIEKGWGGDKGELNLFLESIYRAKKFPPSSLEQRELLKLVRVDEKELSRALDRHVGKYNFLSVYNIDDECFDSQYYTNRISNFKKNNEEYLKTKSSLELAEKEIGEAEMLIKKADLSKSIKDRIDFLRWVMYVRTAAVEQMFSVNKAYKPVFNSLSKIFDLPIDAVLHMTYKEILDSLKEGELIIPRELIIDRTKNGYAYLIAPHGSYLVTGKEVDELQDIVIPKEEKKEIKELKGQIAFKGKVIGIARVILDRRNAHEFKEGEILVTTMTSPEFVPAMKIASGIITNEGGVLCHAAIMSREFHKPCIIGTKIATDVIKTGQKIILDADKGVVRILEKAK